MSLLGSPYQQQNKVKVVAGYALQQRLGSGSFATVYKGVKIPPSPDEGADNSTEDASQPDSVAIKAIARTSEKLTKKVLQNLEVEISILRTYRHPNIVCMHNVQKTERHFYLILEYCGGGDVQRLIRTRKVGRLTERLARRLMRDLAAGLKFLWGQELIHRDIKPQNLLLTGALPLDEVNDPDNTPEEAARRRKINFPTEKFALKIADFGFARHLQTASLAETLCGSPLYMAPEILQHHRYDAKADLWSVGTVLFEMIAGKPPFTGENHIDLLRNIQRKAVRLPPDVRVSKPCVNLLRLLLNRNPLSRAGFKEFFDASDAFVALGCEGIATQVTAGSTTTSRLPGGTNNKELGTIHENDGAGAPAPPGSDSLMTVATTAPTTQQQPFLPPQQQPPQLQQQQQQQQQQHIVPQTHNVPIKPNRVFGNPPSVPMTNPTSLVGHHAHQHNRTYASRLAPLTQSPPNSSPLLYHASRGPAAPPLVGHSRQPWHQPQQQLQHPAPHGAELVQTSNARRNIDMSQSQASTDDSGFVMVELGANSRNDFYDQYQQQQQQQPGVGNNIRHNMPGGVLTPSSPQYYMNSRQPPTPSPMPPKGMLSTSPGTGGLLMGLVGRAPRLVSYDKSAKIGDEIATVNKMLATAEDVGRRAVSVAHLGDTRAYLGMRLMYMSAEQGSSLLSVTPMEGVEEETSMTQQPVAGSGVVSTELMATGTTQRRTSIVSTDKYMTEAKADDDDQEEMPFAISPETPAVALPSRTNLSVYSRGGGGSGGGSGSNSMGSQKKTSTGRPDPQSIKTHYCEALACYLKALKMLKGVVGAAQRVAKDLDALSGRLGSNPTNDYDIPQLQKRCEVTSSWLAGQFRGVLERADAANSEIAKLNQTSAAGVTTGVAGGNGGPAGTSGNQTTVNDTPMIIVEELIYNHSLASGRDGAVKQLLGQYDAARSCYRSAGLLAETLLMEPAIGEEDRKILEGYVDGFAARINELDRLVAESQNHRDPITNPASATDGTTVAMTNPGSDVIGLIGPPPSAPTGFLTGMP